MADPSVDSQLDALFSRLAALQESNNFKKALRVVDEGGNIDHVPAL